MTADIPVKPMKFEPCASTALWLLVRTTRFPENFVSIIWKENRVRKNSRSLTGTPTTQTYGGLVNRGREG
jgi:hypothetical protein